MNSIYVNPFERDYASYNEHLIAFNRSFQKNLALDLDNLFKDKEGIAITTTGSDGRLEKGPVSPIEVLVLRRDNIFDETLKILKDYTCATNGKNVFNKYWEVKNIEQDSLYKCLAYNNEGSIVEFNSPNRIFDLRLLYGDKSIFSDALNKFGLELKSSKGKNMLRMLKERVKTHSNISLSGLQNFKKSGLIHYNLESGESFYNPSKNLWSFKQGPLRTIQYALIRDLTKKVREGFSSEVIFDLPKNVVEKLNRLEVEGLSNITPGQLDELTDSYKYFSHLYHKSQFKYVQDKTEVIYFDPKDVRERCSSVRNICSASLTR